MKNYDESVKRNHNPILIEFLIIDGSESGKIYVLVNLTIFVHQRSI